MIVCFGPGPKFKGGIAQYNTALARALKDEGAQVNIVSWTQQYPAIIPREFVDKASRSDLLEGYDIPVRYLTNWNDPRTWWKTAKAITDLKPDKVILQWYNPTQGIPLNTIAKYLRKHTQAEVLFDLHFVAAKEQSSLDARLTRMALRHGHSFIVHAYKTAEELKALMPEKTFEVTLDGRSEARTLVFGLRSMARTDHGPKTKDLRSSTILKLYHPIYSLFKPDPAFDMEAWKSQHGLRKHVFLFFGFIRKYKGLHHCIEAFAELAKQRDDVSLMVVGERFWQTVDQSKLSTKLKNAVFGTLKKLFLKKADDERDYDPLAMIGRFGLKERVLVVDRFIPNEEVPPYFQAADTIVLFYETATPSGVESLSYNFKLPAVATRVGHFPETITDGFNGYLANPNDITDMVRVMNASIEKPIPRENVVEATKAMSWANYAKAVLAG
ncbi:MAG: glycosyltransferase [Flavobacteriales bacterium]|jgi:glycosyltransferase involved in cell wall biosynthesis|nr:glycosyltransferase [Flavobacteriales bacterium]